MRVPASYDVFCRVVDNFGDAAVCWRLARALALEQQARVRLWIDAPAILARLVPSAANRQNLDGVEIHTWLTSTPEDVPAAADVVVEAFGCGLPPAYVDAMLRNTRQPLWLVLEYLSAEAWVAAHHGLPSPHPQYPLDRYFFFPGFTRGTGGLLRECDLFARRDGFGKAQRETFWNDVGHSMPPADALVVSLFAYETAPLAEWLDGWVHGERKIVAAIPEGPLLASALAHLGGTNAERVLVRGALEIRALAFLAQSRYDELLWSCDVNFVRGEDSFMRAQWAARPLIWHVYPQQAQAHHAKLEAFLKLYCEGLEAEAGLAIARVMRAWNQTDAARVSPASAWKALIAQRALIKRHARTWSARLADAGELAANLAQFSAGKLK